MFYSRNRHKNSTKNEVLLLKVIVHGVVTEVAVFVKQLTSSSDMLIHKNY